MKRNQEMPKVDMVKLSMVLTADEMEIVSQFVKADGTIRASKPKVERFVASQEKVCNQYGCFIDKKYDTNELQGKAAYTWRHVVFFVSPKSQHQCMPTLDFCDLPKSVISQGYTMNNPQIEALHRLADKVVDCVNIEDLNGVKRWGMALGQIGTPQVRENGSIVYR